MNVILYLVRNRTNGKVYVGQTRQGLARRWSRHLWDARQGSPNRFHAAIRRYGAEDFDVSHVSTVLKPEWADEAEMRLISEYNSFNRGYNDTKGGGGGKGSKHRLGKTHTPEARAKISAAKMGRPGTRLGRKNSPEHNEKVRQANLGKKMSEETKRKLSVLFKGRAPVNKGVPASEETRRKQSEAQKKRIRPPGIMDNAHAYWRNGGKHSEESKHKMSEARKGWKMPAEQVERLRTVVTGRTHSEETKRRISEAKRAYWARKKELAA